MDSFIERHWKHILVMLFVCIVVAGIFFVTKLQIYGLYENQPKFENHNTHPIKNTEAQIITYGTQSQSRVSKPNLSVPSSKDIEVVKKQNKTIDAKNIAMDYRENEVYAEGKYKNKNLEISGVVYRISTGIFGGIYVELEDGVRCEFVDSERNSVARLRKGQKITVSGKGSTYVLGTFCMNDCEIVR